MTNKEKELRRENREYRRYAKDRVLNLKDLRNAFVSIMEQTINDLAKSRMGKVFRFNYEQTIPNPYTAGEVAYMTGVYYNGTETRVLFRDPENGVGTEECNLNRLDYDEQYNIALTLSQDDKLATYTGEWV